MTDPKTKFDQLTRLSALALGLEGEGYFGASKLCRALLHSLLTRAALEQGIPHKSHGLIEALENEIALLRDDPAAARILPALETGLAAAREDRTNTFEEVPDVWVCRACGEIYLAEPPNQCPRCDSDSLTFWNVPAMFYLEPLPPERIMPALERFPQTLRDAIAGLSEADMQREPAPEQWSIRDTVWHLLMAQGVLAARVERLLTQENPSLEAKAVWTMETGDSVSMADILAQFERSRGETLERLSGLSWDDWMRSGWHTEFGRVTLLQQATYFGVHERYHLPQITDIRRVLGI